MSCLAQIPVCGHLDQIGPLAGRGDLSDKVLHIFTCERLTICSFWQPDGGANAAFFLDTGELGDHGPGTVVPAVPILPEVWIEGWVPHDDAVPDGAAESFTDVAQFNELPRELQFPHDFESTLRTKLGGVPYWTGQGPAESPPHPFRFLMQIDKFLMVAETAQGYVDLANFCSDGTGFVFVDTERAELPASFLVSR